MLVLAENRVELVLEAAGLDRAVDPALLGSVDFPPPPAGAQLLARRDSACARSAADRRVAVVVQGVVGNVALPDVLPDLFLGPFRERVQLHDRSGVVIELALA